MSLLAPLYLIGALAVVAPILFHLIRRTTRGEIPFSSLLFLAPSPPRLTRRSRLDHWPLLLLRATALILLATAFARPFLRELSILNLGSAERSRVVVLVDRSASMRRGDLWKKAQAAATAAIEATQPDDEVAVLAFDTETRTLQSFDASRTLQSGQSRAGARNQIASLTPTWGVGDLGLALIQAVGAIEDVGDEARKSARLKRRVILVSDLAQGSKLEALGDYEWPKDVELELKTVAVAGSNAGLIAQAAPAEEGATTAPTPDQPGTLRVRVVNDVGSMRDNFTLSWTGDNRPPTTVYVPPGESRVAKLEPPATPVPLRLVGDDFDFDNRLFVAADPTTEASVLFVGPDNREDTSAMLFYLDRVFSAVPQNNRLTVLPSLPTALIKSPTTKRSVPLVILGAETSAENVAFLQNFVREGGTLLAVPSAGRAEALAAVAGVPAFDIDNGPVVGDILWGEIAFDHPLFAPFAAPQFNDFTKIHFWKRRQIWADDLGPDTRVVARFEGGDPAILEKPLGKGQIIVMASGWTPADGQLARSSKFVPLMNAILHRGESAPAPTQVRVGDPFPIPPDARSIRKPDGSDVPVTAGVTSFRDTDLPGLYAIESAGTKTRQVAVNLDPSESKTAPLEVETLKQFGCQIASPTREAAEREGQRQMQNAELEGRQKAWRWLILATIGVLILETGLAGWLGRPRTLLSAAEVPAT